MKKERLTELLHLLAMGRCDMVDELADILTGKPEKAECDLCVMPGGKHFGPCLNNPDQSLQWYMKMSSFRGIENKGTPIGAAQVYEDTFPAFESTTK